MECEWVWVSDLNGIWASVLGWPAFCLGGDIHRPVMSYRAKKVESHPNADHPRPVRLCGGVRCGGSWWLCWCEKRAGQGGCGGGGGGGTSGGGGGGRWRWQVKWKWKVECGRRWSEWQPPLLGGWLAVIVAWPLCALLFGTREKKKAWLHWLPRVWCYSLGLCQLPQLIPGGRIASPMGSCKVKKGLVFCWRVLCPVHVQSLVWNRTK